MVGDNMTELIKEDNRYGNNGHIGYDQNEVDRIRTLLLGHRIAKIADDHLQLDDGTVIKIVANSGCGGCPSGNYDLTELNGCDNVVTAVDFVEGVGGNTGDPWGNVSVYSVFVIAEDRRINLYTVEGDDGNGYYGTGYELLVRFPKGNDDA